MQKNKPTGVLIKKMAALLSIVFFLLIPSFSFSSGGIPVKLALSKIPDNPALNQVFDVSLVVTSLVTSENVSIQINITKGLERLSGEHIWKGPMKAGDEKKMDVTLRVIDLSRQVISAVASVEFSNKMIISGTSSLYIGKEKLLEKTYHFGKNRFGEDVLEYPADTSIIYFPEKASK